MEYKGYEIDARIGGTYSDLWSLDENGSLKESCNVQILNDDTSILWYEVCDLAGSSCKDKDGTALYFVDIPTLEEARRRIDLYKNQNKEQS